MVQNRVYIVHTSANRHSKDFYSYTEAEAYAQQVANRKGTSIDIDIVRLDNKDNFVSQGFAGRVKPGQKAKATPKNLPTWYTKGTSKKPARKAPTRRSQAKPDLFKELFG